MSNSNGVPSETELNLHANKALTDGRDGSLLQASGEQRMAMVALALREMEADKGRTIATLATCLTSKESATTMRDLMVEHYVAAPIDTSAGKNDNSADQAGLRGSQIAMIARAVQLAGILDKHNLSYLAFEQEMGVFQVPPALLLDPSKKEAFIGPAAMMDTVMLCDRGLLVSRENKDGQTVYGNVRTSIARLKAIHAPKKPRVVAGKVGAGDKAPTEAEAGKIPADLFAMIREASRIINEPETDGSMTRADFDDATWNALATLSMTFHTLSEKAARVDAPKPAKAKVKQAA